MTTNKKNGLIFGAIVLISTILNGAESSTTVNNKNKITDIQCEIDMEQIVQILGTKGKISVSNVNRLDNLLANVQTSCKNDTRYMLHLDKLSEYIEYRINITEENTKDNFVFANRVQELFSIITFSNTDLKNKKLSKILIENNDMVIDQCVVKEVDYSGSGYKIDCKLPDTKQFLTLYSDSDDVEDIKRDQTIIFAGTIESIDAKNDYIDMQILKVNITSWN